MAAPNTNVSLTVTVARKDGSRRDSGAPKTASNTAMTQ
jgi:hypothetical protein